ncbi:hypothetical protein PSTG_13367 [Puccinia striiformis f. sp. tritici PST-78]|uniref:Myb/SANT-like domain-containing protein n=1 Tax=Puccinia striiformis f. sp. tritici PST-78 TaxID=1165861 RepID=A0A0L0V1U6_9BASI|nr:hypothetical protein PSTG_13367 [Puccinia striiformis f. sp. tritici PST-78]
MSPNKPKDINSFIDPAFLPVSIPVPNSETLRGKSAPMVTLKKPPQKKNVPKKQVATKKAVSQTKKTVEEDESKSELETKRIEWTTTLKQTLLELFAEQKPARLATDTTGLKKEGWTMMAKKMNARYDLGFTVTTIRNQKNLLRQQFSDYQFLCGQSGFGWDNDQGAVTADKSVWDEIFAAHPQCEFNKLVDKPFPLYDLAYSVFNGKSASGKMVTLERVPTTTTANKVTPASKRKAAVVNDEDSEIEVDPTSSVTSASTKRICESKNSVIKKEMEGIQGALVTVSKNSEELMGAFTKISWAISGAHSSNPGNHLNTNIFTSNNQEMDLSMSQKALDVLANRFLGKVDDNMYVASINILEEEVEARTFILISKSSTNQISQTWLASEVAKAKNIV